MITSIGDVMREAYKRGWITTRDGNVSVRKTNRFYITPSGTRKNIIYPESIIRGIYKDSNLKIDLTKVSGEFEMHRRIHELVGRPCNSIVHLHPTYTLAAMEMGWDLDYMASLFPEITRYTKVGQNTPVLDVCSTELAEATLKALSGPSRQLEYDIVGQPRHGVTAVAKTPWDAFEHIERLEHISQIVVLARKNPND